MSEAELPIQEDVVALIRGDGRVERLETGGVPVGLFGQSRYTEGLAEMNPGDLLVLFTDGITEARDSRGEEYGWERLRDVLRRDRFRACPEIARSVLEDQERFSAGEAQDDRTLLLIRCLEAAAGAGRRDLG